MSKSIFSISGKTVFITGAAGIIGPCVCRMLLENGANVVGLDVNPAVTDQANAWGSFTEKYLGIVCDISKAEAVNSAVSAALGKFGRIDVLMNNAQGKSYFIPFEEYDLDKWHETMKVNVDGAVLCAQAVGKHMIKEGRGGCIIQTSSIYGSLAPDFRIYEGCTTAQGIPMTSPAVYTVSKAAVEGLSRYLASYWAKYGIRVNTIIPGGVKFKQSEKFIANYSGRVPVGRMAEVDDLFGAILFLASDASSYVTGQEIYVDGGLHVW